MPKNLTRPKHELQICPGTSMLSSLLRNVEIQAWNTLPVFNTQQVLKYQEFALI